MRKRFLVGVTILAMVVATSAEAGPGFRAVLSGGAAWHVDEGPDLAGRGGNFALHLQTTSVQGNRPLVGEGGAFVEFEGVEGITLSELGYDIRNGDLCDDTDPRLFVTTEPEGDQFHFGCTEGLHTPAPDDPLGWTRIRFTDADANTVNATWPGFGNVVVRSIDIVFLVPTGPQTHMDNFDINGVLIGGPGTHS